MSVSSLHSVSSWMFSAVGTIVSYHELSTSFSYQHLLRFLGLITFSQAVPRTSDFIVIVLRCPGSCESGLLQTYVLNSIKYSTLLFELFPPRPKILHHHQDLSRKHSSWNRILAPSLVPCPPVSPEPRLSNTSAIFFHPQSQKDCLLGWRGGSELRQVIALPED